MTDLDVYQPAAGIGQYQAGIVMTPESAKALDDQVRLCTKAVLREGTDYGVIPGTNGEKTLWRPGAQKLLQWFRLECTCERIDIERDDDGRKHGITYRAEVGRGLKTATPVDPRHLRRHRRLRRVQVLPARRRGPAQGREPTSANGPRKTAASPTRPVEAAAGEYRADWNALMKRAQKRAIVGAVVDATAAGGIFTDREEDDTPGTAGRRAVLVRAGTRGQPSPSPTSRHGAARCSSTPRRPHATACARPARPTTCRTASPSAPGSLKKATPVDVEDLAARPPARPSEAATMASQRAGTRAEDQRRGPARHASARRS